MINTQTKSLLSLLSVSRPHVIKMTSHRHTRLKLNQMGGNTVPHSILRKSDYKTFFCPHVVCLPFLLPLWIWRKSPGRQAHRFFLIVHGCPHRVSMWVCGHAVGLMSVCDSRCLVGGDGVCLHVHVWEEWSLLPTGFSNRTGKNKSTIFLRWGAFEVMTSFEPELKMSVFVNCQDFLMALVLFL